MSLTSSPKARLLGCAIFYLLIGQSAFAQSANEETGTAIYERFKAAWNNEQYLAARDAASLLVEQRREKYGAQSAELISSLINLAGTEVKVKEWAAAIEHAQEARQIIAARDDVPFSAVYAAAQVEADGHLGAKDGKAARAVLYEILRANGKEKPVDRLREADICDRLVKAAEALQDVRDGNRYALRALKARESHHGKESKNLLPGLHEAARWYRFSSQFGRERKLHRRAIEIMETNYGVTDERLATPLRGIASSYMFDNEGAKEAERALRRATNLEFSDSPQAVYVQALTLAELGDYLVVFKDPADSTELYVRAWKTLAEHPTIGPNIANETFRQVRLLYYRLPSAPANTGKGADYFAAGHVKVEFTVTALGTVEDIEILERKPLEMKPQRFYRAYGKARFRPRLIAGEVVATRGVKHQSNYSFTNR